MRMSFPVAAAAIFAAIGCADGETAPDGGGDGGDDLGAIEITGNWGGAKPDGVTFDVAVFACPFNMPPEYYHPAGAVDPDTGDVHDLIESVPPGEWCLMAFIDMIPDDDIMPVEGTDAISATGAENENGAIPLDVVAGETTQINLVFEILQAAEALNIRATVSTGFPRSYVYFFQN